MYENHLTPDVIRSVRAAVEVDPGIMLDRLADRLSVPEGVAAVALPRDMCTVFPAVEFERIWIAMTDWQKVTFIAVTPGAIVEFKGRLPQGRLEHGFFNIGEDCHPLAGHLMTHQLKAICFVSKPFMGLESHCVRFYNESGQAMFAVYVGRQGKQVIPTVKESFLALRDSIKPMEVTA